MKTRTSPLLLVAITLLPALLNSPAWAEITVEPFGLTAALEAGDSLEIPVILTNTGDHDVAFTVKFSEVEQEGRRLGPRRDEAGDVLDEYEIPYPSTTGLAWDPDNEWIWGYCNNPQGTIFAFDPEQGEIVADYDGVEEKQQNLTYWEGLLYLQGNTRAANTIFVYDLEGDQVDQINTPFRLEFRHSTISEWDDQPLFFIRGTRTPNGRVGEGSDAVYVYTWPDFDEVARIQDADETRDESTCGVLWVPMDTDGQLWVDGTNQLYELFVDDDWNCELVQEFDVDRTPERAGITHDKFDIWRAVRQWENSRPLDDHTMLQRIDDGVFEPYWLVITPDEGIVSAGGEQELTALYNATEIEPGVYEMQILIRLDDPLISTIEMSGVLTTGADAANITGIVTSARSGAAIEGARASLDRYHFYRFSNAGGEYTLDALPMGQYEVTFSAADFLDSTVIVDLNQAGDYALSVALLHSECTPDTLEFRAVLPADSAEEHTIRVTNGGNGPLTWRTEKHLPGGADADPWTLRQSINVGEVVRDSRIEGAVFVNDQFYVTGGDNADEPDENVNYIYVLDRDGNLIDLFRQPGSTRYGMFDLDWGDGLLWGAASDAIYGFTTSGEVAAAWEGPQHTNHAIAWDSDRELLWIAGITSNQIIGCNRNGNPLAELRQRQFRIYGLAYWPEDPDGYNLYIFHNPDLDYQFVHKMNPETGDTMFVAKLAPEAGGSPRGCYITGDYDIYSWVFMGVIDDGASDRIDIYQVAGITSWMQVEPEEGQITAGEAQDVALNINATGMDANDYEGQVVFIHDGVGGETAVSVYLTVLPGPSPPGAFDLLEPADGDTIRTSEVTFLWQQSLDPNPEDTVRYELWFMHNDESFFLPTDSSSLAIALDTIPAWNVELPTSVTWWVAAWSGEDRVESNRRFHFIIPALGASDKQSTPTVFGLSGAYPNPFNARTRITFSLPEAARVNLIVFDLAGRLVADLTNGEQEAGVHSALFDARELTSGVYLVRLEAAGNVARQKLALVK